jgi:hypothetical protein
MLLLSPLLLLKPAILVIPVISVMTTITDQERETAKGDVEFGVDGPLGGWGVGVKSLDPFTGREHYFSSSSFSLFPIPPPFFLSQLPKSFYTSL